MVPSPNDSIGVVRARSETDLALATDAELIRNVREGDNESYGILWTRYSVKARYFAKYRCNVNDPEDVVSEAYVATLEAIRNGKGPSEDFYPYLATAVRNAAAKLRSVNVSDSKDDMDLWAEAVPSAEEEVEKNEVSRRILTVFYAMNPRYRQVLWMAEVQGMKSGAISAELGLHGNHGASLLNRAREQFRKMWTELETRQAPAVQEGAMAQDEAGLPPGITTLGKSLAVGVLGAGALSIVAAGEAEAAMIAAPGPMPAAVVSALKATGAAGASGQPGSSSHVAPKVVGAVVGVAAVVALIAFLLTPPPVTVVAPPTPTMSVTSQGPSPLPVPTQTTTPEPQPSPSPSPTPTRKRTPPPIDVNTDTAAPQPPKPPKPPKPPTPKQTIVIESFDAGPHGVCYPVVSGTALAGSTVHLVIDMTTLAGVHVGSNGIWTAGPLTSWPAGTRSLRVTDPAGKQNDSATERVRVPGPATLSVTVVGATLSVHTQGVPGTAAQVSVDGAEVGSVAYPASGMATGRFPWTGSPGSHTLTLRYTDVGCVGPSLSLRFDA